MAEAKVLKHDPLSEGDIILGQDFYGAGPRRRPARRSSASARPRPTHYRVVCISLYTKDIEALEATVAELKRRGYSKANRSQVIRYALSQLEIDKLPAPPP